MNAFIIIGVLVIIYYEYKINFIHEKRSRLFDQIETSYNNILHSKEITINLLYEQNTELEKKIFNLSLKEIEKNEKNNNR